jgi:hypothetical protein
MTDYEALIAYGHSPARAKQIVLECKRGVPFSLAWVASVRSAMAEDTKPPDPHKPS